jgi:hypothetical protein
VPVTVFDRTDARGADKRLDEPGESYTLEVSTDLPGGRQGLLLVGESILKAGYRLTTIATFLGFEGKYRRICGITWTLENTSQQPGANITAFNSGIAALDAGVQGQLPLPPGGAATVSPPPAAKCKVVPRFIGGPTFNPVAPDLETIELVDEPTCLEGDQLAATLLFPYFEVDLDDVNGPTTLAAISNASDVCTLTRVTLWTDYALPTLTFYAYLSPDDVQSFNFRALFNGDLPDTTSVLTNPHCPILDFEVCQSQQIETELVNLQLQSLRADHTGKANPVNQMCAGSDHGDNIARGYATVDVVNRCTFDPTVTTYDAAEWDAPEGYFEATETSHRNVLWGDFFSIDPSQDSAQSEAAVPIRSDPERFSPGNYTFYGRYVGFDASDGRVPLSGETSVRFLNGGSFDGGTAFTVWRDNRSPSLDPVVCGDQPDWAPLPQNAVAIFDEDELPVAPPVGDLFPLATQRVPVGGGAFPLALPFGWIDLDLWHDSSTPAQSWVSATLTALGRYSVQHRAVRRDDLCEVDAVTEMVVP